MNLGVFSQPANPGWQSIGVDTYVRYEPQDDVPGHATVSPLQWRQNVAAAGGRYLCQPLWDDLYGDAKDPRLAGWLHEQDEPDNAIVARMDAKDPAGIEAVYAKLETDYRHLKAIGPTVPVAVTVDLWQAKWGKPDYQRIFAAADWILADYYFVSLGETIDALIERLGWLKSQAKGKRLGVFVNASWINDNPTYHPKDRAPTPDELLGSLAAIAKIGAEPILFPQHFNDFAYDYMTVQARACTQGWMRRSQLQPPPAPLGMVITTAGYLPTLATLQPA